MSRRLWGVMGHRAALALAAALVAAGCSKKSDAGTETAGSSAPPSTSATTPAAPASTVHVKDVELGSAIGADKKVTKKTDSFRPTETIYASVETEGSASDATLRAVWTYGKNGQVVHEETRTVAPTGPATTEFHVAKPSGWPKGDYKVEIFLDGQSVGSESFTVK
ncbi:MAG TPA: hypothetical protein VFS40_06560 [Gemmatimonadales bacterium]|nr:hypothetical protein [Gemmatimonadales bacterium]